MTTDISTLLRLMSSQRQASPHRVAENFDPPFSLLLPKSGFIKTVHLLDKYFREAV